MLANRQVFRTYLQQTYQSHPELFPAEMNDGFTFHGFVISHKQQLTTRRIKLTNQEVYQVRPSFVMPDMTGRTDEMEKALYLRRFGVPFDALAYVFGRDAMFWYRATVSLGRYSLVGTTVKKPSNLPANVTRYSIAYQHPGAPRTTNMVDRLINYHPRILFDMPLFHGTLP